MARKSKRFSLRFIIDFYDVLLREPGLKAAARALEIGYHTLLKYLEKDENLRMVRDLADQRRGNRDSLHDYVFGQLSEEARAVWKQIEFWKESNNKAQIDALLSGKTKRLKQELFIHALTVTGFDLSEACQMISINRDTLYHWRDLDPSFRKLVEEIQWHKKNFFEHALLDLVAMRHPGAVMFVNRTVNADRGYTERLEVKHSGSIANGGFSFEDLDLDLETRKKILQAIKDKEARDQQRALPPPTQPTNVEEQEDEQPEQEVIDV